MNFSIRPHIRAFAKPNHVLSCSTTLWKSLQAELWRRGKGRHESGAFLLGTENNERFRIEHYVPYDDLDPSCLDNGIIELDGSAYGPLHEICRQKQLLVIADIHTHPRAPWQSESDRTNPMISCAGHIGLIAPNFARHPLRPIDLGIYEYMGSHRWHDHSAQASSYFYVGWL